MVAGGQHADRHAHQRQRHDRLAAHGVDVGDRVGGGDAAEVERVVDDRHEEVGGGDQRLLVVELVDGGVVGGLDAHQQFRRHRQARRALEDFGQHAGRDLAAAAAAVRQRGEAGFGGGGGQRGVHGGGFQFLQQVKEARRARCPRRTAARAARIVRASRASRPAAGSSAAWLARQSTQQPRPAPRRRRAGSSPRSPRPSMPTLPGTRLASTGVPQRTASMMTWAPPSSALVCTSTWARADALAVFPRGAAAPSQR